MAIREIDPHLLEKLSPSKNKKLKRDEGFKKLFDLKLSELHPTTLGDPIDNRKKVLDHGDRLLNLLDDYGSMLSDPSKTSLDMESLVGRIEKEIERIEAEAADRISDDETLSDLINDLSVVANVAVSKYHRGDFR
jgi:hypothetical protein